MGTYDGNPPVESESKDEQRIKDFMAMKYERKRWYVDPSSATFKSQPLPPQQISSPPPLPDSRPLTTLVGNNVKPLVVQTNNQVGVYLFFLQRPLIPAVPSSKDF